MATNPATNRVAPVLVAAVALAAAGCAAGSSHPAARRAPLKPDPTTTVPTTSTTHAPSAVPTTAPTPVQPTPGWTAPLTTLPPGGGFTSLSCISDTFCVAVGGGTDGSGATATSGSGVTVSWDGASWSQPSVYYPTPVGGTVTAPVLPSISCTAGPSCTIVDGSAHLSRGDGTNWSAPVAAATAPGPPPNPSDPGPGHAGSRTSSISCPGPSLCAVVDNTGQAGVVRNSGPLSLQPLAVPGAGVSLYQTGRVGVTCRGTASCTAVVGPWILDWDGTGWSVEPAPWTTTPPAGPTAIACPTSQLCAIVSGPEVWVRRAGQPWSSAGTIDPGGVLDAIACPSATFCLAADEQGKALSWNGSGWSAPSQVVPGAVQYAGGGTFVSCPTASFCMVMNGDGDYATYAGTATPRG